MVGKLKLFEILYLQKDILFCRTGEGRLLEALYSEENRLKTYRRWPLTYIRPQDLAKAGKVSIVSLLRKNCHLLRNSLTYVNRYKLITSHL